MLEHVYRRTALCGLVDDVVVATCDDEIREAVGAFGGTVVMTSPLHERASDRVGEVAQGTVADIYVMVQGDEPMVHPEMIEAALAPFGEDRDVVVSNLFATIDDEADFANPDTIKVVMDERGDALFFSREPIPTRRLSGFDSRYANKQVCVIPFRRDFLLRYIALAPSPLEILESIDMLRALEHGYRVRMVRSTHPSHAVDNPRDLERVAALLRLDPLTRSY
jgi:3-deoxy-manno-octulosonate cytidylyltransferase (CMP-KDO synthetase)